MAMITKVSANPSIPSVLLSALLACSISGQAQEVPPAERKATWQLEDLPTSHQEDLNISGIAMSKDEQLMIVGADEESHIQVLERTGDGKYNLIEGGNVQLALQETEADIEGIARDDKYLYVIGSHSMKRQLIKEPDELEKKHQKRRQKGKELDQDYNHKRIETVAIEPTREWLFRLRLKKNGTLVEGSIQRVSLRDIFANHPVLARFRNIPSKENGIDVEGLAVVLQAKDDKHSNTSKLVVGLRGPSLRGPFAIALVVLLEEKKQKLEVELKKTRYLALDGRGIRGLSEMDKEDEYLVLAGPIGDEPSGYLLYYWNGKDTIPEIDQLNAKENVRPICQIPPPEGQRAAKAEGVHFLDKKDGKIEFVIVYDGAKNGLPTVFSCDFKRSS